MATQQPHAHGVDVATSVFGEQGIKFYDPEIVGDTPETVESRGVSNIVAALRDQLGLRSGKVIFAADGSVSPPPYFLHSGMLCA